MSPEELDEIKTMLKGALSIHSDPATAATLVLAVKLGGIQHQLAGLSEKVGDIDFNLDQMRSLLDARMPRQD